MNWVVDCTTTVTVRSCRTSVKLLLKIATTTPRTTRCGGRSTPTPCCWLSTNSVSARIRWLPRRSPLIPTISPTWRESRPATGKSPSSLLSPWFSNAISVSARTRTSQRRPFSSCTLITLRWKSTAVIIPWMLILLDVDPSSAHRDLDSLSAHAAVGRSSNAATNAAMSFIGGLLLTTRFTCDDVWGARKFSTPWVGASHEYKSAPICGTPPKRHDVTRAGLRDAFRGWRRKNRIGGCALKRMPPIRTGAPGGSRTPTHWVRSPALYPLSYGRTG